MYEIRWHLTNLLFRFGMWIAPRGAARDVLDKALEDYSDHVIATVRLAELSRKERDDNA